MIQLRYATISAEATGLSGNLDEGLEWVRELLKRAHELGELEWAAEMQRVEGELLLGLDSDSATPSFERSISLARKQGAKSLELRATVDLARLWGQSGRIGEARLRLSQVFGRFNEGFDLPDLVAAQKLLRELEATP